MKKERICEVENFFVTWIQYSIFVFILTLIGTVIINGLYAFITWDWNTIFEQIKETGWLYLRCVVAISIIIAFFITLTDRSDNE